MRPIDIKPPEWGILFHDAPSFPEEKLPPVDKDATFFLFIRERGSEVITILLPNGDNYDLSPQALERYLGLYILPEDLRARLIGFIHDFGVVLFDRGSHKYFDVPKELAYDDATGRVRVSPDLAACHC